MVLLTGVPVDSQRHSNDEQLVLFLKQCKFCFGQIFLSFEFFCIDEEQHGTQVLTQLSFTNQSQRID